MQKNQQYSIFFFLIICTYNYHFYSIPFFAFLSRRRRQLGGGVHSKVPKYPSAQPSEWFGKGEPGCTTSALLRTRCQFPIQRSDGREVAHRRRPRHRRSHHYSVRFLCKNYSYGRHCGRARAHTHTHSCTPVSAAVGGKTAQPMLSCSNLTGIKWPLHRGSHMCACARMYTLCKKKQKNNTLTHMHAHAHIITTGGDEMNVRQQEDYTGNQPSTARKKKKKREENYKGDASHSSTLNKRTPSSEK